MRRKLFQFLVLWKHIFCQALRLFTFSVVRTVFFLFVFFDYISSRRSRPEVFCKKGALRNFSQFTGKHLCQSLFFRVAWLKTRFWHRCFLMNFVKFLRTHFFIEHLWWLGCASSRYTIQRCTIHAKIMQTWSLYIKVNHDVKEVKK